MWLELLMCEQGLNVDFAMYHHSVTRWGFFLYKNLFFDDTIHIMYKNDLVNTSNI